MRPQRFRDRRDAGRALAAGLGAYAHQPGVIVLGLPRGGVPVAAEVADALAATLDVWIVRKLGLPWQPELAMGAIASGGARVLNDEVVRYSGVAADEIARVTEDESAELARRERLYRADRPPPDLRGRTVVLVDDGLATGSTMRVAVASVRQQRPAKVIVAVPVASAEAREALGRAADEIVCLRTPEPFQAVGMWYERFDQTTDDEVRELLDARAGRTP